MLTIDVSGEVKSESDLYAVLKNMKPATWEGCYSRIDGGPYQALGHQVWARV